MALKIVRIPRAPKSSFHKDQEISSLLKSQVDHVAAAEQRLPRSKRPTIDASSIVTEHEAAEYVGSVMKRLLPKARKRWKLPPGKRAPKSGIRLGPARLTSPRPKKRPRKTTRRKTKRTRKAGKKR